MIPLPGEPAVLEDWSSVFEDLAGVLPELTGILNGIAFAAAIWGLIALTFWLGL